MPASLFCYICCTVAVLIKLEILAGALGTGSQFAYIAPLQWVVIGALLFTSRQKVPGCCVILFLFCGIFLFCFCLFFCFVFQGRGVQEAHKRVKEETDIMYTL